MKSLLVLAVVAFGAVILLKSYRERLIKEDQNSRIRAEKILTSMRGGPTPEPEGQSVLSRLPDGRWIEHDSRSGGMQSVGGGGGGARPKAKVNDNRDILPWKNKPNNLGKGGALDQSAR